MKASALGVWYSDAAELEEKVIGDKKKGVKGVEEWKELVREKCRAFSVLVGDNCIANIKSIDALIGMVTSKVGKRYAFTGFEALKEMFISSLLPDRKLKTLSQQPLDLLPESKDGNSLLLFWHWEECLKQRDPNMNSRLCIAEVDKFSFPTKFCIAAQVPALYVKYTYVFIVNFLREIQLTKIGDGPKVAKRLLDVYFALFKVLISEAGGPNKKKKSKEEYKRPTSTFPKDKNAKTEADTYVEMDARILKALLNVSIPAFGINRAFGFVSNNEADDVVEAQTPMLFQLVSLERILMSDPSALNTSNVSTSVNIRNFTDRFPFSSSLSTLVPASFYFLKSLKQNHLYGHMNCQNELAEDELEHLKTY
ncbi:CCAAT/enhancer-binding protein zeta [Tanacetum coccineum]